MVNLFNSFSKIKKQKVMVIGDFMLDTYTVGKVRRISPEAPVPILQVHHEEHRAGGAGNVALNLISMGIQVITIGRTGNDAGGTLLTNALRDEGIETTGLVVQEKFSTPVKNRVIADNQQIVRVDHEKIVQLPEQLEQQVIDRLPEWMDDVKLVAISDYGKGFITRTLVSAIVECAASKQIPVLVDPKGVDFSKYKGVDLIKPNLSEVYAAANLPPESPLEYAAARILESSKAKVLMVTRSEEGISLFHHDGKRQDFPVRIREVKDVTGAGDTVLAMLATAMANGLTIAEGAQLSNIAAGIAIERFGCARVTLSDLARRLLADDAGSKVFDEQHLFALQEAVKGRRFALLGVNSSEGISTSLFSTIRQLAQKENWDLLVYIKDLNPDQEFINALATLHDVDYIIVNTSSLKHLCKLIKTDDIYAFEDGTLNSGAHTLI